MRTFLDGSVTATASERSSDSAGTLMAQGSQLRDRVRHGRDVKRTQHQANNGASCAEEYDFPVHVHFGAGKLGLGLVVPALEQSETRYVILQRPSQDWAPLERAAGGEDGTSVALLVNGEEVVGGGLKLITQADLDGAAAEGRSLRDLLADSKEGQGHLLLTSDAEAQAALVGGATSFSCALGTALCQVLGPLLGRLSRAPRVARPTLYACENDLESVETLAGQLKMRVNVVPCMVDRICSSRSVFADPGAAAIHVEAEEHTGSIVLLEQSVQSHDELPLDGETVQVPDSEEVADYLFVQKKRLVNSMHTVLAFSTLVEHDRRTAPLFRWDEALPHLPLINYAAADAKLQDAIWAWAVAQILVLMKEKGVDVMTAAHSAETDDELVEQMLSVARQTLERFSSVEDTTTRVLGGGVSNRFHTRLLPVQEGMHLVAAMIADLPQDCAQRKVLAAADVDLDAIVEACDSLVDDASKFAQLDDQERALQAELKQLTGGLSSNILSFLNRFPSAVGKATVYTGAACMAFVDRISQS